MQSMVSGQASTSFSADSVPGRLRRRSPRLKDIVDKFRCDNCGRTFVTYRDLMSHVEEVHLAGTKKKTNLLVSVGLDDENRDFCGDCCVMKRPSLPRCRTRRDGFVDQFLPEWNPGMPDKQLLLLPESRSMSGKNSQRLGKSNDRPSGRDSGAVEESELISVPEIITVKSEAYDVASDNASGIEIDSLTSIISHGSMNTTVSGVGSELKDPLGGDPDNAKRYWCNQCDKVFESCKGFHKHITTGNEHAVEMVDMDWNASNGSHCEQNPSPIDKSRAVNQTPPYVHVCFYCQMSYMTKDNLKMHIKEAHTNTAIYGCSLCNERFGSYELCERHVAIAHSRYACTLCGKTFAEKTEFNAHTDLVAHDKRSCWRETKSASCIRYTRYKCVRCDELFVSNKDLRMHARITHRHNDGGPNHGNVNYICALCGERFQSHEAQRIHIEMAHCNNSSRSVSNGAGSSQPTARTYACTNCDKRFKSKYAATIHAKMFGHGVARIVDDDQDHSHGRRDDRFQPYKGRPVPISMIQTGNVVAAIKTEMETVSGQSEPVVAEQTCGACGKHFKSKFALTIHEKMNGHGVANVNQVKSEDALAKAVCNPRPSNIPIVKRIGI